ncbi:MAG: tripartite tricarboxylate transporter substrate binding protein [Burkholderiaceae bacterium]|nr:tripartite tricarboxylate transporter substrate binding protein [Burkholderiaceae bacterium]
MKISVTAVGRLATAFSIAAGMAVAAPAVAQPLTYVIAFPAGGESDVTARIQEPILRKIANRDVVVQYKVGAGGATAWASLNKSPADGNTIMGTNFPHIFLQPMQKDVGYKTEDIVNVYVFQQTPDAIVVPADSPYKTLQDLIDAAKKTPGAITISGSGTNSGPHLSTATFNKLAGTKLTYIPFSGTATSVAAMLGKQVNAAMTFTTAAIQQGDRARMLAVALEERLPSHPDVPTFKELGIEMVSGVYRGVAVPKATPEAKRKELSDLFAKVNQDADYRKKMKEGGFVVVDVPYEKMDAFMKARGQEYEAAARDVGMIK